MTTANIIKSCNNIKNGAFFGIKWVTSCDKKMSATAKKQGIIVTKHVTSVCRKGVHYSAIKKVQEMMNQKGDFLVDPQTGKRVYIIEPREWAEDVVPNLIVRHKKTGKEYMVVYTTGTKPKVQYYMNGKPITTQALKESGVMQNSYWNNNSNASVLTVPVESITDIYQGGNK